MKFRIRNTDYDDDSKYQESEKAYREHLKKFIGTEYNDLWKFFYWDFFHDGHLETITIREDLRTVEMKLDCPNIKLLKENNEYEYVSADFKCIFSDVSSFTIHYDRPGIDWDSKKYTSQFLYAEINTSPLLKTPDRGDPDNPEDYYSLVIKFDAGDCCIWLELVFSQVDVCAKEPVAFTLMESDPKYEVPTYSGN